MLLCYRVASSSICPKINLAKKAKLIREVGEAEKATLTLRRQQRREALYKIDCLHTIASKEFRVRLEKEMTHFVQKAFFATKKMRKVDYG